MIDRPSSVIFGTVRHVVQPNTVEVRLSLGFGVHIDETVHVEGIPAIHPDALDRATHCAVLAIGGKKAYFVVPCPREVARKCPIIADMYLYNESNPLVSASKKPDWSDVALTHVPTLFTILAKDGWNPRNAIQIIRGSR